ncbi:Methyl-accepting chemotaxis protein [Beggiatoa sp. PS]|nr:Methyl-accepting chemotaxis protein [Beggiatoa sp. PS]
MQIIKAQKNHIIAPDDATMRALETTIKTEREKLFNALVAFEVTLDEGTETQAFEQFQIVLNAFLQDNAQVILLSQSNTDDEAQALSVGKASDKFEEAFSLMETMRETNIVGSKQAKIAADQAARTGVMLTLVTSLMITIIVIIVAVGIANSIANPIMIVTKAVRNLATGKVKSTGIDSVEVEKILTRRDEMGEIGRAFENLVIYFQSVIADIVQVSQGLAEGNLHIMPQTEYRGDFVHIKNALETALSNQRLVIEDIVKVSQGLAEGNLSITPQSEYQGDFIQIKNAQESALSNQRQVIEDIVQVSQGLANGHLNMTSKAIYQGDFAQIKTALETALSNLRQVIEDIVRVSQGLAEGTQNVTSQAEYQGDFVQIKIALTSATTKLAETSAKNTTQDWLKTGQTQLNER